MARCSVSRSTMRVVWSAVAVPYPSRSPPARRARHVVSPERTHPPCDRRVFMSSPGRSVRGSVPAVGRYEFRVKEGPRGLEPLRDPSRARDGVRRRMKLSGDPVVTTKRVPLPRIGPRTEFIVRFPAATRRLEPPDGRTDHAETEHHDNVRRNADERPSRAARANAAGRSTVPSR